MRSHSKPSTGSHRFATLEIVNEAGRKSASFLGENPDRISDNHRSRMRVVQIGISIQHPSPFTWSRFEGS